MPFPQLESPFFSTLSQQLLLGFKSIKALTSSENFFDSFPSTFLYLYAFTAFFYVLLYKYLFSYVYCLQDS